MAWPEAPSRRGRDRGQLDAGVFEDLVQAVGMAGALQDEELAVPGEIAECKKWGRGAQSWDG
jgi:hypothetical protein